MVKAKTAESEEQWVKLKADFAERKRFRTEIWNLQHIIGKSNKCDKCPLVLIGSFSRLLASSSESGISDMEAASTSTENKNSPDRPAPSAGKNEVSESKPLLATHIEDDFEELSEEIPDPFSDDEGDLDALPNDAFLQQPIGMVTSITSMVNVDIEDEDEEEADEKEEEGLTPIFVPSLSYLAQVANILSQLRSCDVIFAPPRSQVSFRQQCLVLKKEQRWRSLASPCVYP